MQYDLVDRPKPEPKTSLFIAQLTGLPDTHALGTHFARIEEAIVERICRALEINDARHALILHSEYILSLRKGVTGYNLYIFRELNE